MSTSEEIEDRLRRLEDKILIHGDILQRILEVLRIQGSKENDKREVKPSKPSRSKKGGELNGGLSTG